MAIATVTDKIIAELDSGVRPGSSHGTAPRHQRPSPVRFATMASLVPASTSSSGREQSRGFSSSTWMTYRQAVRRESRMKGVTHGSMSSVRSVATFPMRRR